MAFEPVFETINVKNKRDNIIDRLKVECRSEVACDSVAKIINVSAFPQAGECEVNKGTLKYGGKITFFICYEDREGNVRKCECGSEFTGSAQNSALNEDLKAIAFASCEKTEVSLSGIKLSVIAYVKINAEIYESCKCEALSGGDKLIIDGKEASYSKSYGVRRSVYPVDEEFEVGYKIEEVLHQKATAVITAVQCGVGVIIVDGELYFSAIFLQSGDKRDIIKETRSFPFRMEIECEDAMPAFYATAKVYERSLKTEISVDQENGSSVVNLSVALGFYGEAFSEESLTLADDCFSLTDDVELERQTVCSCREKEVRSLLSKTSARAEIEEIPVGASLFAVIGERVEVVSAARAENGITVGGTLAINCIFCDNENKTFSRKAEIPFETFAECNLAEKDDFEILAACKNVQAKIVSLTEIEISAELIFTVYPKEIKTFSCIKGVKSIGVKSAPECAISVYIPREGEGLWSLSKRLNVCPDSLVSTNKELQFPLTGKERIVVYRK